MLVRSWDLFIAVECGGLADTLVGAALLSHKAARLLDHMRRRGGAGVPLHTESWGLDRIRHAAQRGSHCLAQEEVEFVCVEVLDFRWHGFATVLPLQTAMHSLRLLPLRAVPQHDLRPRLICGLHLLRCQ